MAVFDIVNIVLVVIRSAGGEAAHNHESQPGFLKKSTAGDFYKHE
jgi:hypothetical protein